MEVSDLARLCHQIIRWVDAKLCNPLEFEWDQLSADRQRKFQNRVELYLKYPEVPAQSSEDHLIILVIEVLRPFLAPIPMTPWPAPPHSSEGEGQGFGAMVAMSLECLVSRFLLANPHLRSDQLIIKYGATPDCPDVIQIWIDKKKPA